MMSTKRRGSMMLEAVMAVSLLATAFVGVAQLLALSVHQRVDLRYRLIAVEEAANALDRAMGADWNRLEAGSRSVELSDAARQLPGARLRVHVRAAAMGGGADASPPAKHLVVELDWIDRHRQRVRPVRLEAWRFLAETSP